ncbi:tripartite tricarboxylate transporter permease [Thermanaerovibrio acidaminovorans]|uniref:tripartite tricarboxylate transporter permease n=1 Tax=Thermanaerovibrio acidaminovorans TaxID=81462 RepID=UPI0024926DDD|nr:tripartite tricarboxylate transporter permease [Thermanaerovibrio acidaminovorans]
MEVLGYLAQGFLVAMTPVNLVWMVAGSALGTVLGMLPGLGPSTGIALLLPLTFGMRPETALIAMCAIYYGAMFGGSRSSILLNVPGDGAAVASAFDGYPMACKGQAEAALAISAIASFIGGLLSTIAFVLVALPVARFALRFGPPEYFCLMIFALAATAAISKEALLKGIISLVFGLMLSTVGLDFQSGVPRFTFGSQELQMGIDFVVVIIGIYGISEVFVNLEHIADNVAKPVQSKFGRIWITMEQWKKSIGPILRQTPIGFLIGVLPGAGGTIAALMAYNNEKQISKHPEEFGKGAIEGLAAPEAANNACSVGALIPMMTLGVPGSGTTAVMLGALLILGLQPGPLLFEQHPDVAWGIIASMFLGNVVCALINIPLAGALVRVLSVPPKLLYPLVVVLAFLGVYTINFSVMDFYLLTILGLVGYLMKKFKVPTAPLILASVVGASMESSFRQSLMLSNGSLAVFFRSWICLVLLLAAAVSVAWPFISDWRSKRNQGEAVDVPVD